MDRVDQMLVDSEFQTPLENFGNFFFNFFRELQVGFTEQQVFAYCTKSRDFLDFEDYSHTHN